MRRLRLVLGAVEFTAETDEPFRLEASATSLFAILIRSFSAERI